MFLRQGVLVRRRRWKGTNLRPAASIHLVRLPHGRVRPFPPRQESPIPFLLVVVGIWNQMVQTIRHCHWRSFLLSRPCSLPTNPRIERQGSRGDGDLASFPDAGFIHGLA